MARNFPGAATDFLSAGNPTALAITGTALTLAAWIRPTTFPAAHAAVLAKRVNLDASCQYYLRINAASTARVQIGDGAAADTLDGVTALTANVWSHIAGVKSGTGAGSLALYLNGAMNASMTSARSIAAQSHPVSFGIESDLTTKPFPGRIAELAVWSVGLSAAEIAALAAGVAPTRVRPASLAGYWPFWGVAVPEPDLSGNGNNGSQTGSVPGADHAPVGPPVPSVY